MFNRAKKTLEIGGPITLMTNPALKRPTSCTKSNSKTKSKTKKKVKKSKQSKQTIENYKEQNEDNHYYANSERKNPEEETTERQVLLTNIELINKQMFDSQEVLQEQNKYLTKFNNLKQYVNSFDYNLDKMIIKMENDDFSNKALILCKNNSELTSKIGTIKKEIKNIQYMKEENKNLKYKHELIAIDVSRIIAYIKII